MSLAAGHGLSTPSYATLTEADLASQFRLAPEEKAWAARRGPSMVVLLTQLKVFQSIGQLLEQLDPQCFVQIHRSVIVNLRAVDRIERDLLGKSQVYLRDRADVLTVSRSFLDRFKQS